MNFKGVSPELRKQALEILILGKGCKTVEERINDLLSLPYTYINDEERYQNAVFDKGLIQAYANGFEYNLSIAPSKSEMRAELEIYKQIKLDLEELGVDLSKDENSTEFLSAEYHRIELISGGLRTSHTFRVPDRKYLNMVLQKQD